VVLWRAWDGTLDESFQTPPRESGSAGRSRLLGAAFRGAAGEQDRRGSPKSADLDGGREAQGRRAPFLESLLVNP